MEAAWEIKAFFRPKGQRKIALKTAILPHLYRFQFYISHGYGKIAE